MKFIALMLLAISALPAFAQRVDIEIEGRPYSCVPREGRPEPRPDGDPSQCANRAYSGPFTREESIRLCEGARDDSPARCALKAYAGPFTREESITICTRARSEGPADCALKAYSGPFTRAEAMDLCSSPRADVGTAQCALNAYSGPYTREESIRMCRGSKKGLFAPELLSKLDAEAVLILANEKAVKHGEFKK